MGHIKSLFGDEPIINWAERLPSFDGKTYEPARDHRRLGAQYLRTWDAMKDGKWKTLETISRETGDPQASVSARIRDFRKPKFGAHIIERRYVEAGLYEYRIVLSP